MNTGQKRFARQHREAGKRLKVKLSLEDLAKQEKPWLRQDSESPQRYEMFEYWMSLPSTERTHARVQEKFPNLTHKTIEMYASYNKWIFRAEKRDVLMAERALEKSMDSGIDYLVRAQTATQKIVATLAEKVVAALDEDDDEKIKKAIEKLKPFTALLSGYGKLGEFLLQAHETFHGTKQTLDANIKGQLLQWGTPVMKQVVDTTAAPSQLTYDNSQTAAQ